MRFAKRNRNKSVVMKKDSGYPVAAIYYDTGYTDAAMKRMKFEIKGLLNIYIATVSVEGKTFFLCSILKYSYK